MAEPLTLFDVNEVQFVAPDPTIEDAFVAFHQANGWVYAWLVSETRKLLNTGHTRVGIAMLFEVLRWNWMQRTDTAGFGLNNNYRSRYARLIMASEPDLADVFEVRELRAA